MKISQRDKARLLIEVARVFEAEKASPMLALAAAVQLSRDLADHVGLGVEGLVLLVQETQVTTALQHPAKPALVQP